MVLSVDPSETTDNLQNQKLSYGWGKSCTTLSPPFFALQNCYIARGIRKISSIRNAALKKPGPKTSQRQHEATPYMGIPCWAKYKLRPHLTKPIAAPVSKGFSSGFGSIFGTPRFIIPRMPRRASLLNRSWCLFELLQTITLLGHADVSGVLDAWAYGPKS